jgi:hypothetical protein
MEGAFALDLMRLLIEALVGVRRRRPALLPLAMMPAASGTGELTIPVRLAELAGVINSEGERH